MDSDTLTDKRYPSLKAAISNYIKRNELTNTAISTDNLSNTIANLNKRCTAIAKYSGKRCLMRSIGNTGKCKLHGGLSTGAKTLEGKIKNLSKLKQYKNNPDLFAEKVRQLKAEYDSKD